MAWSPEKAKAAVKSLSRIRAAESAPDERGIKTVWHQGAEAADLVSYVDPQGKVTEQTLTLLTDHYAWTAKAGLKTGHVGPAEGSKAAVASDAVMLDRNLSGERVIRGAEALESYSGQDKYILHFKNLLRLARQGLQSFDEEQVTNFVTASDGAGLRKEVARGKRKKDRQRRIIVLVGAAGAVLILAAIALLLG